MRTSAVVVQLCLAAELLCTTVFVVAAAVATEEASLPSSPLPLHSFSSSSSSSWLSEASNVAAAASAMSAADQYRPWQKIVFSLFIFPIITLSVCGNILVIVAISKYDYLKIPNNIFLASLAVADCAVGILAMTPNALQLLTGHWYLRALMCRFWFSCDVLFSTASILHLCCVSIDRFLSISDTYALNYACEHATKSWRVRVMIAAVWIVSALLSFVPIFTNLFTTAEQVAIIDRLDHEHGQCSFVVNLPYRFISSIVSFWLPALALVTFYTLVMRKAYYLQNTEFKKYRSFHSHTSSILSNQTIAGGGGAGGHRSSNEPSHANNNNNNNTSENLHNFSNANTSNNENGARTGSRGSKDIVARSWKREYKALKTLGTVIVVFCLCWIFFFLRYTLCGLTYNFCPDFIAQNQVVEDILFWIGYFNSMINPFLYNFTNPDFRRAFKDLLHLRGDPYRRRHQQHQRERRVPLGCFDRLLRERPSPYSTRSTPCVSQQSVSLKRSTMVPSAC